MSLPDVVQRLENLSNGLAVVVGGKTGFRFLLRARCGALPAIIEKKSLSAGGVAVRVARRRGSDLAASAGVETGGRDAAGGGAMPCMLSFSRMCNASWIADNAASVGSFAFFGLLAISVVALALILGTRTAARSD